ncbi:hypothetical protein RB653_004040 [Dictyostelium firmibasis]|uniref:tRNAHis guanylyltransferase catalytic domain-containing protein n=1 Tax=Dictyostelium firmibasis TaxID=79012 RepID=A0AAN7Z309_9MYCE
MNRTLFFKNYSHKLTINTRSPKSQQLQQILNNQNNNNNSLNLRFFTVTHSFGNNKIKVASSPIFDKNNNNNNNSSDKKKNNSNNKMVDIEPMGFLTLGDRMKSYEDGMKIQIEKNSSYIIRLDGHSFSKFSKSFKKPGLAWDLRIHQAMVETATALMKTFMPTVIYTFSDEITMCFPSIDQDSMDEGEIPQLAFSGKVQKLISLTAGLASTVFYKSITQAPYDSEKEEKIINLLKTATPTFDSRLFVLPSNDEIRHNLIWRSIIDCKRNSISQVGQAHFSQKQLHGMSSQEVKNKLLHEKGINFDDEPDWYKYGVYLKKQNYLHKGFSPINPTMDIEVVRNRVVPFSFDITKLSNSNDFITKKILNEDFKLEFNSNPLSLSGSTNSTNSNSSEGSFV